MKQLSGIAVQLAATALLVAGMALVPLQSSAGSLGDSEIGMFPKELAEFAYTDLKSSRQRPWFRAFQNQLLPPHFREFEQFLLSAGIDPNTRVDELAWGQFPASKKAGEEVVGIGFGSFDPSSNEERFKQQRLPMVNYQGYHLYGTGAGSGAGDIMFTFLNSNMAAFGHRSALEKLVDLRMGRGESLLTNDRLFPLISEADANNDRVIWAVFDKGDARRAIQRFIPQAALIPQTAVAINRLRSVMVNIDAGNSLDVRFEAVCDSVDDANLLGAALQAGLMYWRSQQDQAHPDPAQEMLGSIRVTPTGDRLIVESSLNDDQLGALGKTLAVTM